jgi:hypothetical protein
VKEVHFSPRSDTPIPMAAPALSFLRNDDNNVGANYLASALSQLRDGGRRR